MPEDFFSRTLNRCSYEGVEFPCSDFDVKGSKSRAEHTTYKGDGADIEPTGRDAYSGSFTVPLYNGVDNVNDWFPGRYYDLLGAFEASRIGQLVHPTKGQFDVHIDSWEEKASASARNGILLTVSWTEHNASAGKLIDGQRDNPERSTETAAAEVDAELLAFDSVHDFQTIPAGYPYAGLVDTALASVSQGATRADIESGTREITSAASDLINLPDLESVDAHPAVWAAEKMRASAYRLREKMLPNAQRASIYVVPQDMTIWKIAASIYGNAAKASLLTSANAILNPLKVPAGQRLLVPPK